MLSLTNSTVWSFVSSIPEILSRNYNGIVAMTVSAANNFYLMFPSHDERVEKKKYTPFGKKAASNEDREDAERRAVAMLSQHFIRMYRNSLKRKKLRKVIYAEV